MIDNTTTKRSSEMAIIAVISLVGIALFTFGAIAVFDSLHLLRDKDETTATQQAVEPTTNPLEQPVATDTPSRYTDTERYANAIQGALNVDEVTDILNAFADTYDTEIRTESGSTYWAVWNEISNLQLEAYKSYASIFVDEWSKYPPEWIAIHDVNTIWLVSDLVVDGDPRAAMPDAPDAMVYDITYGAAEYAQSVIHHEWHHFVDYSRTNDYYFSDARWRSFNNSDFQYGNGGASAYTDPNYIALDHPEDGFVSNYARYGEEEDRAEVFSYLFYTPQYRQLSEWIKDDQALANKVTFMINQLSNEHPDFSTEFFENIHR